MTSDPYVELLLFTERIPCVIQADFSTRTVCTRTFLFIVTTRKS